MAAKVIKLKIKKEDEPTGMMVTGPLDGTGVKVGLTVALKETEAPFLV